MVISFDKICVSNIQYTVPDLFSTRNSCMFNENKTYYNKNVSSCRKRPVYLWVAKQKLVIRLDLYLFLVAIKKMYLSTLFMYLSVHVQQLLVIYIEREVQLLQSLKNVIPKLY